MIRKKTVSLFVAVVLSLTLLFSLVAVNLTDHNGGVNGSHPSAAVLADEIPAPTATPAGAGTDSNPSGGGNGGG